MDLGLKDKVAVVTGASAGIGRSIALALADEGAHLAICARRPGPLREMEAAFRARGAKFYAAACDVGDSTALDGFLDATQREFGRVDILVNNASGVGVSDDEPGWTASLNIDLLASIRASRKVIPWMVESGGGSILFISSVAGLEAGAPPPYAAAKAALISYSKSLSVNLASKRIRVNAIAPGPIEFEGGYWANVRANYRALYDMMLASIPAGRLGTPEEVAQVAVFLASERTAWITGECICVDGGLHKSNR